MPKRIRFIDNLRTVLIFLVVANHSGLVYESSGVTSEFWIVDDPQTNHFVGLINLIIDIFVIVAFFLLSGFFAAKSLAQHGAAKFIKRRSSRLLIPWLIGVVFLMPIYKWIFLFSRKLPQESWEQYLYLNNGILSQSWLWFLPVLFCFSVLYSFFERQVRQLGAKSISTLVILMLLTGFVYSFTMEWLGWRGWTKSAFLDFQNERLLIYAMAFVLGAIMYHKKSFERAFIPGWAFHTANTLIFLPVCTYIVFLLNPVLNPGFVLLSPLADTSIKWLSFQISILGLTLIFLESGRRCLNKTNWLFELFNQHSLSIYVVHVIVLGILATAMLNLDAPSFLKYIILAAGTFIGSFAIAFGIAKISDTLTKMKSGIKHSREC